jgi:hypothetical protein
MLGRRLVALENPPLEAYAVTRIVVGLAQRSPRGFKDLASRTGFDPFGKVRSAARAENFRYHQERPTKWRRRARWQVSSPKVVKRSRHPSMKRSSRAV